MIMTLTELRNHIDAIDDQLMTLLNERFALMQQVKCIMLLDYLV
jgi:chorismate mutase